LKKPPSKAPFFAAGSRIKAWSDSLEKPPIVPKHIKKFFFGEVNIKDGEVNIRNREVQVMG
jgi:hypothetical protein